MRFKLDEDCDVRPGEENLAAVKSLVQFKQLGFKRVARFFSTKGYGFDEDGVFFHERQIHNASQVCPKGESWLMKGRIEGSPKGKKYADGTAVNLDAMSVNGIEILEGEYYEKYKADEWKRDFGAKPGEMWWAVSFYYAYGSAYTFLAVKLTDEEASAYVATKAAHKAAKEQYRREHPPKPDEGSGST